MCYETGLASHYAQVHARLMGQTKAPPPIVAPAAPEVILEPEIRDNQASKASINATRSEAIPELEEPVCVPPPNIDAEDDLDRIVWVLSELGAQGPIDLTPRVFRLVALAWQVRLREMIGSSRRPIYARPRQVAMAICTVHLRHSLPACGRACRRDHTTVLYASRRFGDLVRQAQARIAT